MPTVASYNPHISKSDQYVIGRYNQFENEKEQFAKGINELNLQGVPLKDAYSKLIDSAPNQWFNTYSEKIPVTMNGNGGTYKQILDFFNKRRHSPEREQRIEAASILHVDPKQIENPYQDEYEKCMTSFLLKGEDDELMKAVKSAKLVKKVKMVHRDGKTFFATYYVDPTTGEKFSNIKTESPTAHLHHEEFGIGDDIFYHDKDMLMRGKVKRFEFGTKKYPSGAAILDLGGGKEKAIALHTKSKIEVATKDYKPAAGTVSMTAKYATDITGMVIPSSVASLGGSSDAKLVTLTDGTKFVIKEPRDGTNVEQLQVETLADKIYKLFGAGAPDSFMTKKDGKDVKAALFLRDTCQLGSFTPTEKLQVYPELKKHFILDCLLGNWDVIGANEDNILVDDRGTPYRVDNGGSMFFRARGSEKPPSSFAGDVQELSTFLDKNPVTAKIFKDIPVAEKKRQTLELIAKEKELGALIDKSDLKMVRKTQLINILHQRIAYLKKEFVDEKPKPVDPYGDYDKSKYPSKATATYFESDKWKNLVVEGNEGIKEHVKQQIIDIEKRQEGTYKSIAARMGISVEELKIKLLDKVTKLVGESDFFRATDVYYLDRILLTDKRYKSQFETGTSHGSLYPEGRSRTENEYFGFKDSVKADKEKRPIYGYYSSDPNGIINHEGTHPPPNVVGSYGRVTVKIKKEVALRKATITHDDSLGSEGQMAATFAAMPHFTSWGYSNPLQWESTKKRGSYTEAQYHNQLTIDDIESIHFSTKNFLSEKDAITQVNKMVDIARHTKIPIKFY